MHQVKFQLMQFFLSFQNYTVCINSILHFKIILYIYAYNCKKNILEIVPLEIAVGKTILHFPLTAFHLLKMLPNTSSSPGARSHEPPWISPLKG